MNSRSLSTNPVLLSKLCSRDGTESDWQLFYAQYKGLVARWCIRFGVDPGELDDIYHEILLKLVHSVAQYDPESGHRFRSWLKTIVLNALVDRLRVAKNNPFPAPVGDIHEWVAHTPESGGIPDDLDRLADELTLHSSPAARILSRCRSRVAADTWDAFVRREVLDEPVAVIARDMGLRKASVYQSVSRLRGIIREESRRHFDGLHGP
jgi:RNA polymerase sigma factor (sigma-70 family)